MFKKIVVIIAMIGIVGGSMLAPVFSARAQTYAKLNLANGGTTLSGTTSTWKILVTSSGVDPNDDEVTISIWEKDTSGANAVKTKIVTDAPVTLNPDGTGVYETAAVLKNTFTYSAVASSDTGISLGTGTVSQNGVVSNAIEISIDNQGIPTEVQNNTSSVTSSVSNGLGGPTTSVGNNSLPTCDILESDTWAGCFARAFYYIFFVPTSFLFSLSGQLLDWAMGFTLDSNSYKGSGATFVEQGWKIARDIANIMFIFILLWVGIGTILGNHNVNAKNTIKNVILVALLLNFSLFFARVVIDASNILGGVFYNNIGVNDTANVSNPWILL